MTRPRTEERSAVSGSAREQNPEHRALALVTGDFEFRTVRQVGGHCADLDPARRSELDVAVEGHLYRGPVVADWCGGRVRGLERRFDEDQPWEVVVAVVEDGRVGAVRAQLPAALRSGGRGRGPGSRGEQHVHRSCAADDDRWYGFALCGGCGRFDLLTTQSAIDGGADDVEATAALCQGLTLLRAQRHGTGHGRQSAA